MHSQRVRDYVGHENALIWNPVWDSYNRYRLDVVDGKPNAVIDATIDGQVFELSPSTVGAVWFRRPQPEWPNRHFRSLVYFITRERDDTLDGILRAWQRNGVTIINRPEASFAASNKPRQLLAAAAAGFKVPATTITNDPDAVSIRLNEHGDCVLKGVSLSGADYEGTHRAIFVEPISERALGTMSAQLPSCPATVQNAIDWVKAIRVVKCGHFTQAFDLPRKGGIDWRLFQNGTDATPRELPGSVGRMLDELFQSLGIGYGAVDLLEDEAGDIYFLEVNPNGQWLWLEEESGWPLLREMVNAFTT